MSNQQQQNRQAPAVFTKPRLPYHPHFKEKFGIDISTWKVLCETIFPTAKKSESVVMAWNYCKARMLDIFKKPVHIVPIWDRETSRWIETVWPGISELRTTAMRTGKYAGRDPSVFGPTVEKTFKKTDKGGVEQKVTIKFPEWCQVTVYRKVDGQRVSFPGATVYWEETFATQGKAEFPNHMWQKRPHGQLEKCAEAAALRAAFPEELGGEFSAEEMHGQMMGEMRDITPRPKPEDYQEEATEAAEHVDPETGEIIDGEAQEVQEEQPQQEEAAGDDSPGDKPTPEDKEADEKPQPKPKSSQKTAKPAEKQDAAPDTKPDTENPDPNARWKIDTDSMSYLATFKSVLRHTKSEDDVNAMLGVNSEAIAKLHQDTQDAIFKAADERKEALSGG